MKKSLFNYLMILLMAILSSCTGKQKDKDANLYKSSEETNSGLSLLSINASQNGVKYPETFVLMQNRMGIRIEYCLDRSNLQLWISPQAGKSFDYRDKNFSNRDDHCKLFDRILLPNLNLGDFIKCDYDPFYSVLYFKNQKVHILNLYDQPALLVWFEKDDIVELKSDAGDKPLERNDKNFIIEHAERGKTFEYAAVIGNGSGTFQQQIRTDEGRSLYTWAHLKAGQPIVIAGELKKENISSLAKSVSVKDVKNLIKLNESKINNALQYGSFKLKNRDEMQKLLDKNKRIALSMQDEKGFMRSTNQYIYYLLWYRDGGMDAGHICMTGWTDPAKWQANFALLNPNTSNVEPKGKFFGQVMGGPITKWEEDGLFYVAWTAFLYWTQTGDETYVQGKYLNTMEDAMDWLERYCYDKDKGMFFRYYFCESPLTGSVDDGWDNATGKPTSKWGSVYKGDTITKSFDIYINSLNYCNYMMLSAMEKGPKGDEYYKKALTLEKAIKKFMGYKGSLPSYGDLIKKDGHNVVAEPYGMDRTDYSWALTLPMFQPTLFKRYTQVKSELLKNLRKNPKGEFLCSYNALLTSMDNEFYNEDSIMNAMDYLVPQSARPGKYLPMPYTIPEIVDIKDGDPFHDVRPLVYSIAPWLSAVTNLGVRRLPFGIAARSTKYLESISNYSYMDALINISYKGTGKISHLILNGNEVMHSLQIPENLLKKGANSLVVEMSNNVAPKDLLIASTLKLLSMKQNSNKVVFTVKTFGKNTLTFKNLKSKVMISDSKGKTVPTTSQEMREFTLMEFNGRGIYTVTINL